MPPCAPTTLENGDNPLMALVDAAAFLLGQSKRASDEAKGPLLISQDCSSRPATPAACDCTTSNIVSPTSVVSHEKLLQDSMNEKKQSFAEQLMAILDDEKMSDLLTWMPDGKAFTIIDPKQFTKEVMPKTFNIRNMSSFVRKLTRWGFSRVHEKATMNSDIFKHPKFQRGKIDQCRDIKCVGRSSSSPTTASRSLSPAAPTSGVAKALWSPPMASALAVSSSDATIRASSTALPFMPQQALLPVTVKSSIGSMQLDSDPSLQRLALQHWLEQNRPPLPQHAALQLATSWVHGGIWAGYGHPPMSY